MASLIADAKKNVDLKVVNKKEAELENADEDEGEKQKMQKMFMSLRGVEGQL